MSSFLCRMQRFKSRKLQKVGQKKRDPKDKVDRIVESRKHLTTIRWVFPNYPHCISSRRSFYSFFFIFFWQSGAKKSGFCHRTAAEADGCGSITEARVFREVWQDRQSDGQYSERQWNSREFRSFPSASRHFPVSVAVFFIIRRLLRMSRRHTYTLS